MEAILYHTVIASTSKELDAAVNDLLGQGYQLYGSPYLSDHPVEGLGGDRAFYQAMTLDKETRDKNSAKQLKEISQGLAKQQEIKDLKMSGQK